MLQAATANDSAFNRTRAWHRGAGPCNLAEVMDGIFTVSIFALLGETMIGAAWAAAEVGRECSSLHLCPPRPARVCFCKLQPGHLASLRDRAGCPAGS